MIYKVVIPFGKKKKNNGKSYFQGKFYVYFDESSYIRDLDVEFDEVMIDIRSSYSAFQESNKRSWWKFKDEFLKEIKVEHKSRCKNNGLRPAMPCNHEPVCINNEIKILNNDEMNKLSKKFNTWRSKDKKKLTIKNLDGVISGSNASGEMKNPTHSSFQIKQGNYTNFVTVIKKLWNREEFLEENKKKLAKEISFAKHLEIFHWFKCCYDVVQNPMDEEDKELLGEQIKEKLSLQEHIKFRKNLETVIKNRRNTFKSNMDDILEKISGYESINEAKKTKDFQNHERAHIQPVWYFRKKLLENWIEYKDIDLFKTDILNPISDPNNGIWLSPNHHKNFDHGQAYISDNWEFIVNNETEFILDLHYQNNERLKYIQYHKENIFNKL